jgi:protein-L-isoaspartate(D-aspartate) O-methyltransferase
MHAYVLEEIISHLRTNKYSPYYNLNANTTSPQRTTKSTIQFLDVGCGSGYITACFGRWLQSPQSSTEKVITPTTTNNNNNDTHVEVNSGSSMIGLQGYAYGIDIVPELVKLSTENMMKQDSDLLISPSSLLNETTINQPIVSLQVGNGYNGLQEYAPYDIIHVGAAAATIPETLCQQLKVGGLLVVPIDDNNHMLMNTKSQTLYKIERLDDKNNNSTSASSYDPNEFCMTPLLGVRYVPLVQERSKS